MKKHIEKIAELIKELDEYSELLIYDLPRYNLQYEDDVRDHLRQIHFRLTECKGYLSTVKYTRKN